MKMTGSEWAILPCIMNTQFESLHHSNILLSGLNELRRSDKLLDIILLAEGESFKAHRAVLAACSDYFRAMFTDAMKEAEQTEIYLRGVTARGIELIINYAYTSKIELNRNNVQDILSAATHVQMNSIVCACENYLETQIDLENCIDIATISEIYSLEKLKHKTYRFICAHLTEFSKANEINRLAWEQFEHLLICDYPVDCTETEVFKIVLQWCSELNIEQKIARKLFDQVRFNEIKQSDFNRILLSSKKNYFSVIRLSSISQRQKHQQKNCFSINENEKLVMFNGENAAAKKITNSDASVTSNSDNNSDEIINSIEFSNIINNTDQILTNSRGMELALVKIGGFGIDGITNKITYYLPSRKKWHNLTVIPHVEQCNYGTAVLGNELYIVGGCYDVCLKEYIHPFGFRYCSTKNKWTTIAPMQHDRCRFTLNSIDTYLYAIGGSMEMNENDEGYMQEAAICERYNSKTDQWEYLPVLPENRSQHAGAVFRHFLYISGGLDRHRCLSTLWRFNTFCDKWEELAAMLTPRVDHYLLVIKDKIYACGGWYEDQVTDNRRLVDTIDVYDTQKNIWTVETTIPTPKYHTGVVAINQKIYFVGGLHSDAMFDRASSAIHCYDLETKQWSRMDRYPQNVWECTCVTLYVPRCREDMEVLSEKEENS